MQKHKFYKAHMSTSFNQTATADVSIVNAFVTVLFTLGWVSM